LKAIGELRKMELRTLFSELLSIERLSRRVLFGGSDLIDMLRGSPPWEL
jgi:hypothetical protein